MKKNVTKSDKKKKKELADEIAKLEADLEARHKVELDTFRPKRQEVLPPAEEEKEAAKEVQKSEEIVNGSGNDEDSNKRRKNFEG